MSDKNKGEWAFRRSTRLQRSPPKQVDDSTVVDPNASSCQLCNGKDTVEMVECEKCKNWYHFSCVSVDASVASVSWACNNCVAPVNPTRTSSIRSSTSSKRRSRLQLEMLAKEKAIQDKLIEERARLAQQQAAVDSEFLRKEFEIRENMTDSEDDDLAIGGTIETTEYVSDWLTTNPQSNVRMSSKEKNLVVSSGNTDEQFVKAPHSSIITAETPTIDDLVLIPHSSIITAETPTIDDLVLIPPKHVQFAQPLTRQSIETIVATQLVGGGVVSQPTVSTSFKNLVRQFESTTAKTPDVASTDPLSNRSASTELTEPINIRRSHSFSNYLSRPPLIPNPVVPISASQKPSIQQTLNASVPQTSTATSSVPESIFVQIANQQFDAPPVAHQQQQFVPPVIQPSFPVSQQSITAPSSVSVTLPQPQQSTTVPSSDPVNVPVSQQQSSTNVRSSVPINVLVSKQQPSTTIPSSVPENVFEPQQSVTVPSSFQRLPYEAAPFQSTTIPTIQQSLDVPVSFQQTNVNVSHQQQQIHQQLFDPPHRSTTPISSQRTIVASSVQPPLVSVSHQHQQANVPLLYQPQLHQQLFNPIHQSSTPFQVFTSNAHPEQPIPIFTYQPPIVSPVVSQRQQPGLNSNNQSMFGPSLNLGQANDWQTNGIAQLPATTTTSNQWTNYDPQLNPQQLPPSRLQLASRQTMPKDYPKFNGVPEKWSIFINAYVNGTTTCGLSNGENLSRLERCLEDPARKAVQNLLTRPDAVPEIIETLKMLYGRPEASIDAQLRVIRAGAAPEMNKMETFIDFAMSIRNITSEIQKTGMWQYLWNPQLMQELVEKLPYQMRLEWGKIKMNTPNVNLANFSDWLFNQARTACAITLPSITEKSSEPKAKVNSGSHVNAHSRSDDYTKSNCKENSYAKGCHACSGKSHDIYECRKFLGMSLNDKWETVKGNKLCRICLGRHHVLRCESQLLCGESGCSIKHHKLLHNPNKTAYTAMAPEKNQTKGEVHSAHQQRKIAIFRRYIPVTLYGPKGSLNVIAFLDDGSDTTLIENQISQRLGLIGVPTDLFLEWTGKIVRKESSSKSVSLEISGTQTQHKKYKITDARTVKSLDLPSQTVDMNQLRDQYKFLRRIPIDNYTDETPRILIGLKDCQLSTILTIRSGGWYEPVAAKTRLGWEIHGSNTSSGLASKLNFHGNSNDDDMHQMVAQFFSLENFGVKRPEQTVEAISDRRAKRLLEQTTNRIGNKFETGLLWKYDDIQLPDSLPMAKRRLLSLEKRLQRDLNLATKFRSKFLEYIENGYVQKLSPEDEAETNGKTWYLPLFPVTNAKKPGKVRLVWDAAAKVGNVSLNSMLLSGPDLLVSLQGVLYRFREGAYVVTGDIREMFHQVWMRKEDQMSQRFLWRNENSSQIDIYVLLVMSFGATCSPSSAQYVKNFNASQFIEQYPKAEEAIRTNTYVDDWLQSFDTEAEASNIANEVKHVYSLGGFEIRNWLSNSPKISHSLGAIVDDDQVLCIGPDENQTERILGMWWNVQQDAFTYSLRFNPLNKEILSNNRRPTKREVLRTLMSIYDPLGFLAAYLVHLKMILQDIWRTGIGWDQQIKESDDDDLYHRWQNWIKLLPDIENVRISRHYSNKINQSNPTNIELHVFVDAGELAYATVAYFRIENETGVHCSLIGGKTKVAPLKPLSVPRMELQAAVLGARFKNCILENHMQKIVRTVIWSDSSTVLNWLRSDLRRYNQYVGVRVGEILETTSLTEWRWIPSKSNPADDATKWKHSFNLDQNSRWFRGPNFLVQPESFWPKQQIEMETQEELRPKYVHTHSQREIENWGIKFEELSKWKRTMAFVFRFLNNIRARLGKSGYVARSGSLSRLELQSGEISLYRKAQMDEFENEIRKLQIDTHPNWSRPSVEKTSSLYRYSPYIDCDGVLRMRGRIDAASNVSIDQKRPIILPYTHQITELVAREYHVRYNHQNTETVINEIKQKFIIPRLRALVKRIRRTCQHCKNASAQPKPPEMAQLPPGRLASFTRPYTFVGVDYAGPYKIIQFRRPVKRWIVLFTCLTIRSVYIDVVESLTTDSCIMAINRFIARNGQPREFFSDRGTNFVGANNELAREIAKIDHDLLNVKYSNCYTQWNFNPPYAQHMGGAWERLISSMKSTLDKILPQSHYPNHETFVTALAEVENIINSRPLTFVSIEPDDLEALTPNHFLKGSSNGNKPPGIFPSPPTTLRGNWRYAQQIANEFWNKWVREYLPMITRRTKWFDNVKPIEIGDQVIIVDENAPRNMWDRGVVVEALKTGADGRISRVNVRTTDGIYNRPVTKLAVLDLNRQEAKHLTRESLAEGSVTASSDM